MFIQGAWRSEFRKHVQEQCHRSCRKIKCACSSGRRIWRKKSFEIVPYDSVTCNREDSVQFRCTAYGIFSGQITCLSSSYSLPHISDRFDYWARHMTGYMTGFSENLRDFYGCEDSFYLSGRCVMQFDYWLPTFRGILNNGKFLPD